MNQRVKQSSGAKLNPPVRPKDSTVREISVEQQIAGRNGLNTENDVEELERRKVLI